MKVLITGMDGFIGTAISRLLRCSGWDVVGFSNGPMAGKDPFFYKGSVTDLNALRVVFHREKPYACIHLAGLAHANVSYGEMERVRNVNVLGALNTARTAEEAGVKQFVYFSSAKVYGENTPEAGIDEDSEARPMGIYAEAKYCAERELTKITEKSEMGVVIIRPVAVFGSGDSRGNYARLIRAVRSGLFPLIDGGKARRSIAYLDRVAERVNRIIGSEFIPGRTYAFCDGTYELSEIVKSIRKATGYAYFPTVPYPLAKNTACVGDWLYKIALGKEAHMREALTRLTDHFVIRTHHFDADFGPLDSFDLDRAFVETCSQQ